MAEMAEMLNDSENKKNTSIKEAFIIAGLDLFGDYGLDGASTRMLARKAGANMSGIVYYFGGKEGLYRAVLGRIVKRFNERTGKIREETWRQLQNKPGKAQTLHLIINLINVIGQFLNDEVEAKHSEKIILREQTSPTKAFNVLFDGYMKDVLNLMTSLISRYCGQAADSDEVVILGHSLIGQLVSFIATKESLLKNLGATKLNAEQNELMRAVMLRNIEACLKAWAEERGGA